MQQRNNSRLLAVPRFIIQLGLWVTLVTLAACSGGGGGGGSSAPVAVPDSFATGAGQLTLTVNTPGVLGNDTGSGITAEQVSGPSQAQSFTLNPDGSFNYVHNNTSPVTTDSFTYRARNSTGTSSDVTVTINITPPVAVNDNTYSMNAPGGTAGGNVLTNDIPATGLTAELVSSNPQQAASFTFNSNGSFTYQHDGGNATSVTFTYRAKVGAIVSNTATVTININQPPVASNVCPTILDNASAVGVLLPAIDPNGDGTITSFTIDTLPTNGSIDGCSVAPCSLPNGNITYRPNPNSTGRRGMGKFTFHVIDSGGQPSAAATVWVLNSNQVRIMPLGDSITAGIISGNNPASADRIGYRKDLYDGLTTLSAGKYGINFVGSLSEGANAGLIDTNHEGHPGWCSDLVPACSSGDGFAETVDSFLNTNPADVILLHIGTNDSDIPSNVGVNSILNNINTWAAANYPVTVMVARIIPTTDGSLDVQTFNNSVAAIAIDRPYVKVFQVNQQAELDDPGNVNPNFADPSLMGSVLHPNAAGYTKMANRWKADLITGNVLPSCP